LIRLRTCIVLTSASSDRHARRLFPAITPNRTPRAMPVIVRATMTSRSVKPAALFLGLINDDLQGIIVKLLAGITHGDFSCQRVNANTGREIVQGEMQDAPGAATFRKKFQLYDLEHVRVFVDV